jgi:Bifunctional DNA primase/polymerase, N-terminal
MLEAALGYVAAGKPVLPLHWPLSTGEGARCSCGAADCKNVGKHPLTPRGLDSATVDADRVRQWFGRYPLANVGLLLGSAVGAWVLDVDPRHGGDRNLEALCEQHGPLPATCHAFTGSGGDHYFWAWPSDRDVKNGAHRVARGVDVKGDRSYVVAAPSLHASGERYAWDSPPSLTAAPPWLLALAAPVEVPATPSPSARRAGGASEGEGRENRVTRAALYLDTMDPAISGQGGHNATMRAAVQLVCGFNLSTEDAFDLLFHFYNPRCVPPWSERELRHKVESAARADRVGRGYILTAPRKGAA